ncbi:MAG: hypothetical protein IPL65_05645 [Lewinellaceae bacterium]|nr:hypothetical protein [Lewinellaceae bacterium]
MIRTLFCILTGFLFVMQAGAQGITAPEQGVGVIYNRETALNLKVTTNKGWAPGLEWGRLRTYYRTTYYFASLGEIKHPKEQRQSADPSISRSFRPYIYGKQNTLYTLRTGWGVKRYFSEKAKHKGVALGVSYSFGPTLGLLKPYYLAIRRPSPDNPGNSRIIHERYTEENASIFLDNTRILGASPITKGLSELSLLPGANASLAFHMDWGAFDEMVKAMEIGLMVDVFPKSAPILISDQNTPLFFNFFVNFQFGKRR